MKLKNFSCTKNEKEKENIAYYNIINFEEYGPPLTRIILIKHAQNNSMIYW